MPAVTRRGLFSLLAAPLLPRVKGTVNDTVVAGTLQEIWHEDDDDDEVDDLQSVPYAEYRTAALQQIAAGIGISYEDLLRDVNRCSYTSR